jgi:hypothetical protein
MTYSLKNVFVEYHDYKDEPMPTYKPGKYKSILGKYENVIADFVEFYGSSDNPYFRVARTVQQISAVCIVNLANSVFNNPATDLNSINVDSFICNIHEITLEAIRRYYLDADESFMWELEDGNKHVSQDFINAAMSLISMHFSRKNNVAEYSIGKDLSFALKNTILRGVKFSDIKHPHKYYFISTPYEGSCCFVAVGTDQVDEGITYTSFYRDGVIYGAHLYNDLTVDQSSENSRFICNTVLYITNNLHDQVVRDQNPAYDALKLKIEQSRKENRPKLFKRLAGMKPNPVIVVGGNYTIQRLNVDASGKTGTGSKWNVRSLTSGHWKRQACGEKGKERKLIWIEPYWRGPEAAPITRKIAIVK